jgi:hypothetical protein
MARRAARVVMRLHRLTITEAPADAEPATVTTARGGAPRTWDIWLAGALGAGLGLYCADQIARLFILY